MLRARSCSLRSAPRDRRRAGRAHHERARGTRSARYGTHGMRGRQGKSAREVRFPLSSVRGPRVFSRYLSLLSSLRAALLPRSLPRGRARASGHAMHARSESRVCAELCVCLWFVCASFRDLARRAARARVRVCGAKQRNVLFSLVRRLAGLGGPWRPQKHTQTTTGLPYAAAYCVKCVFPQFQKRRPGHQPAVHLPPPGVRVGFISSTGSAVRFARWSPAAEVLAADALSDRRAALGCRSPRGGQRSGYSRRRHRGTAARAGELSRRRVSWRARVRRMWSGKIGEETTMSDKVLGQWC